MGFSMANRRAQAQHVSLVVRTSSIIVLAGCFLLLFCAYSSRPQFEVISDDQFTVLVLFHVHHENVCSSCYIKKKN